MNNKINVLLVQNKAKISNREYNYKNIEKLLTSFKNKKIDLILLPELFAVGWDCSCFCENVETLEDSQTINFLKQISKEYKSNIIGGSLILKDKNENLKNAMPIINKNGELITTYEKMHLYSYLGDYENKIITKGEKLKIVNFGTFKVGVSICYDIRFPEVFRSLTLKGADILVNVSSWPFSRKDHYKILCSSRAIENQSYFIGLSQVGEIRDGKYNCGNSLIIDPLGKILLNMDEKNEECKYYTIDLTKQKNLRQEVKTLLDINERYEVEIIDSKK